MSYDYAGIPIFAVLHPTHSNCSPVEYRLDIYRLFLARIMIDNFKIYGIHRNCKITWESP
jgi:hypothetical protein